MDKFEQLKRAFDESPYAQLLGMQVEEISEGYAKVSMEMRTAFHNWVGRAHGGLVASLADQAFACAANTLERTYFAVQFNINFIATPSEDSRLFSEARLLHRGRTIGVTEMSVYDDRGRKIAHATGTVAGIDARP